MAGGTISLGNISNIKMKVNSSKTYSNSLNNIVLKENMGNVNVESTQTYDYSNDNEINLKLNQRKSAWDKISTFFVEKYIPKKLITTTWYAFSKGNITKTLNNNIMMELEYHNFSADFLGKVANTDNFITLPLLAGLYKAGVSIIAGEPDKALASFSSGFAKDFTSNTLKSGIKYLPFNKFLKASTYKSMKAEWEAHGLSSFAEYQKDFLGNVGKDWKLIGSNIKTVGGTVISGFGVEYAASMISNVVSALAKGEKINLETLAPGSTALKSATKMICATAGEMIGGATGKVIGTAVGATIGEFQVEMFKNEDGEIDEKWCGIATGAEIAGAIAGAVVILIIMGNPAAWVVGVCLLVGATFGFVVTWIWWNCIQPDPGSVKEPIAYST